MIELTHWHVHSLNAGDTRFGISRTVINSEGKFQIERFTRTFKTFKSAFSQANKLNEA
jgi:hypothetical protein